MCSTSSILAPSSFSLYIFHRKIFTLEKCLFLWLYNFNYQRIDAWEEPRQKFILLVKILGHMIVLNAFSMIRKPVFSKHNYGMEVCVPLTFIVNFPTGKDRQTRTLSCRFLSVLSPVIAHTCHAEAGNHCTFPTLAHVRVLQIAPILHARFCV